MSRTYRALAALLAYPEAELVAALPEIRPLVPRQAQPLVEELAALDLFALQERYVALFDRSRALSLHLFEHVHGESRDRGQAMVDLQAMYGASGYRVVPDELPDYVPAFLEYLSLIPDHERRALLGETAHILRALGGRLAQRRSRYAGIFVALLELAGEPGLSVTREETSEEPLDEQWIDPQVSFGPGAQSDIAPVRFYPKAAA